MRKFSFRLTSISGHPEREKEGERKRQGDVVLRDLRSYEHPTPAPFPRVCIRNVSPFAPKSRNNIACSRREVFDTSPEVLPRGLPRDGIKRSRYEAACTRNTLYSRCATVFPNRFQPRLPYVGRMVEKGWLQGGGGHEEEKGRG